MTQQIEMDNAELYSLYNLIQKRDAASVLAEFSSRLSWSEDENVLDVGCGPGDVTTQILLPHLPKEMSSLVGVDLSSNMVEFANEKYSNEKIRFKTLDFATKDMKKHFPEKHFSKIFSFHCLHWIQDQNQMGQNIFTLLRPGGEFLAVLTPSSQLFLALKLLSEHDQFKQYCEDVESVIPPMFYSRNPSEDLKRTLTAQGLDVITCELRLNPVTYPSLEVTTRAFEAYNPFVKRMPEVVKEQYLECFRQIIRQPPVLENSPQILPSGEVHILNPIVVVQARRPVPTWAMHKSSHTCSGLH